MIPTEDTATIPPQSEGESGSETVGFVTYLSEIMHDVQKRRARPTNTLLFYNRCSVLAQASTPNPPVAYWGNFMTLFDGTIIAGTRLDGLGTCFATAPASPGACLVDGTGTKTLPFSTRKLPPIYTTNLAGKTGLPGIDVFFRTSMTNVNVTVQWVKDATGAISTFKAVNNKNPQYTITQTLVARKRPEGYSTGENGVQLFFRPPVATVAVPPGFVNPALVGVPSNVNVDSSANSIIFDITP